MKKLCTLILSLFLSSSLIIYAKEPIQPLPDFDNISVLAYYHTEDTYFKKGLKNKELTDVECLAHIIYGEARGESNIGQIAVGFVVKNRAVKWNKSICEITRQPGEFEARISRLRGSTEEDAWWHALNIAFFLIEQNGYDTYKSPVGDALYFNSLPSEAQGVMGKGRFRAKIGRHYFYGPRH